MPQKRHGPKRKRVIWCVAIVALGLAAATHLVDHFALSSLENRFPKWLPIDADPPYGIIVLGGGVNWSVQDEQSWLNAPANGRVRAFVDLGRRFPLARLLYTGTGSPIPEAELFADHISLFGIDPSRLILETRANNTAENAAFSAEVVGEDRRRRWLLVTSAVHMPRAMGSFRKLGFHVEAYPVDFSDDPNQPDPALMPSSASRAKLGGAIKEWLGLLAYFIVGRTDALFPGP